MIIFKRGSLHVLVLLLGFSFLAFAENEGSSVQKRPLLADLITDKGVKSERGYYTLDPAVIGPFADNNVENAAIHGEPAWASVICGENTFDLKQLQNGQFPTVYCPPNQEAEITIHFPQRKEGTLVYLSAASGGELSAKKVEVSAEKTIQFGLKLNEYHGTYPIETYINGERKVLSFWVGPLTVHEERLNKEEILPEDFKKVVPVRKPQKPLLP